MHPEDVVKQDEFTHDVSVSVWDHRPTNEELLGKRLERGWRPTPSRLQSGDAVLGYAACVFDAYDDADACT